MNKSLISTLATVALMLTAPAIADTQTDLKMCREALTEKGHFEHNQHSLKFSYRKGNSRKRTVFLTLKNRADDSKQTVACELQRKDVVDLTMTPKNR